MKRGIKFLIILLLILPPILLFLSHKIIADGDILSYFYPNAYFLQSHVGSLWNSNILAGFPTSASFQFGFFNPVYRFFYGAFGYINGYHFLNFFYIYLAGFLTYLFARSINLSKNASLLVAASYALSLHWLGNLPILSSFSLLPAMMLVPKKVFSGKIWYGLILSFLLGILLLGAHLEFIIISLLVGGVYSIYLAWEAYSLDKNIVTPLKYLSILLGFVLGGALIGLPQLLNTIYFTPLSVRSGGLSYANASLDSASVFDLIKYILPNFSLRHGTTAEFFPYIGVLASIFAIFAIIKSFKLRGQSLFFTVLFSFCLLMSITYSPLFWIISKLPILGYFRGPARWMFAGNFALAVLAGYGLDYALGNISKWQELTLKIIKIVLIVLGSLGMALSACYWLLGNKINIFSERLFDLYLYKRTTGGLGLNYYHTVLENIIRNTFYNFSLINPQFVIAVLFILIAYVVLKYLPHKKEFALIILLLSVSNLFLVRISEFTFTDPSLITKPPVLAEYIKNKEGENTQYREFSFLIGMASSQKISAIYNNTYMDETEFVLDGLAVNSNVLWGIPSIGGYEPMSFRQNDLIFSAIGDERAYFSDQLATAKITADEKIKIFLSRLPLLSMLNVKYVVSAYAFPANPSFPLVDTVYSTRFKIPIYLYENTKVLPRVYLANTPVFIGSDELKNFDVIIDPKNDFSKNTFIECQTCGNFQNVPSPKDTVTVSDYEDGLLDLKVSTQSGRWLVFSESNLPGWKATIDGQPTTIYTSNYIFQTIYVPKGAHVVKWEYVGITPPFLNGI